MKITHDTRRESYEQLDPSGRKAAILAELERAGYIFQVGKRADPITGVNGVIYSKKAPASAGTDNRGADQKSTLKKYHETGGVSNV